MPYTEGDILIYKGIAGQYSTIIADIPTGNKTITFNFVLCKDDNGNTYAVVQIGTGKSSVQTWMAENLNVGTRIENQNSANDGIIEKYCYEDSAYYCDIYGGLYQWNEKMKYDVTPGVHGIFLGGTWGRKLYSGGENIEDDYAIDMWSGLSVRFIQN
jgi:hypothetical protein